MDALSGSGGYPASPFCPDLAQTWHDQNQPVFNLGASGSGRRWKPRIKCSNSSQQVRKSHLCGGAMHKTHAIVALAEVSGRRRRAVQRMIYARWGNSVLQSEGVVCSDCRFSAEASQLEEKQKSRKAQKAGGWPPWEGANQGEYAAGFGKSLRP